MSAHITIAGIGPGDTLWLPTAVNNALGKADVIIGYTLYMEQIAELHPQIRREISPMRQESARAQRAVDLAKKGESVVIISGGDPGIFGMAGLVLELLARQALDTQISVEVLPGISALNAAAALLGAPLMSDFAVISLSDYQIPLENILARVEAAVKNNFVLCLYNPYSKVRTLPYARTLQILTEQLPGETPIGIVRNASRRTQEVIRTKLKDLPDQHVNMNTIIIVGNRNTYFTNKWMITPRGETNENWQSN